MMRSSTPMPAAALSLSRAWRLRPARQYAYPIFR